MLRRAMAASSVTTVVHDGRMLRLVCVVAATVYLAWWFLVERILPGSFNPLPSRLVVVALGLSVAAFGSTLGRLLRPAFLGFALLLTGHYIYLVWGNHGETAWWAGCLITVAAVSALLDTRAALVGYSATTLAMIVGLSIVDGKLVGSIFPAGVATILVIANVALSTRLRAERQRLEMTQARAERDRAAEGNRFKGRILGLVSHELLTPLQTLQLSVDALIANPSSIDNARIDPLGRISRSTKRLTDLIGQLLDYARLDAGSAIVSPEPIDLVALAKATIDDLAPLAFPKKLLLELVHAGDVPPLQSDRKLVRLVLVNLISNAIRYTDSGAIAVHIEHSPHGHRIRVKDTGPGIAEDDQARIFEAFTKLAPFETKHLPGIGLGLALVNEMARVLGGSVDVESTVGVGSTFTVAFPPTPNAQ
jgi:signal transduction histidine kinase